MSVSVWGGMRLYLWERKRKRDAWRIFLWGLLSDQRQSRFISRSLETRIKTFHFLSSSNDMIKEASVSPGEEFNSRFRKLSISRVEIHLFEGPDHRHTPKRYSKFFESPNNVLAYFLAKVVFIFAPFFKLLLSALKLNFFKNTRFSEKVYKWLLDSNLRPLSHEPVTLTTRPPQRTYKVVLSAVPRGIQTLWPSDRQVSTLIAATTVHEWMFSCSISPTFSFFALIFYGIYSSYKNPFPYF